MTAETIAREHPLAGRARALRLAHIRSAADLGDLLPTLEVLDAYAQDGLPDAARLDPVSSGGTANVYVRMSDILTDLELSQNQIDQGMTRFAAIAASATTVAATTAVSTQTSNSVPPETARALLAWDLRPIRQWVQIICEWDADLGERVEKAVNIGAAFDPSSAAIPAREALAKLQRLLTPDSEWRTAEGEYLRRWRRAAERYIADEVTKQDLIDRAVQAKTLNGQLSAIGKAARANEAPALGPDETRTLIKATVRLIYDWVVALKEAGGNSEVLARQP